MLRTAKSLSFRRTDSGVIPSMVDNGTSQIFDVIRTPRVQAAPFSNQLKNTTKVSYPTVRCRKTPLTVKSADT
ncbi:hypothetical protein CsSME_00011648 [Camellia sinensis var. sinensis]